MKMYTVIKRVHIILKIRLAVANKLKLKKKNVPFLTVEVQSVAKVSFRLFQP